MEVFTTYVNDKLAVVIKVDEEYYEYGDRPAFVFFKGKDVMVRYNKYVPSINMGNRLDINILMKRFIGFLANGEVSITNNTKHNDDELLHVIRDEIQQIKNDRHFIYGGKEVSIS